MRRRRLLILGATVATALAGAVLSPAGAVAAPSEDVRVQIVERAAPGFPVRVQAVRTFHLVGAHWNGSAGLELRAATSGGRWTPWRRLAQEAPVWVGDASRLELRRATSGSVRDLRLSLIASPPVAGGDGVVPLAAGRPPIITRAGWGADESLRRAPPRYAPSVQMAFVHHTVTGNGYSCASSARIVRGIYAFHVLSNGWDDIGYNFLIDRCGRIFEGRYGGMMRPVVGAHSKGFNVGSAGIAMIGTHDGTRPTTPALVSLQRLIAWRLDVAHVDPTGWAAMRSTGNERYPAGEIVLLRRVSGHRDGSPTACPGSALYPLLPAVARSARAIGLPKIWNPRSTSFRRLEPGRSTTVRFRATLSRRSSWTLRVIGPLGGEVVRRTGVGAVIDWTWGGRAPVLRSGAYRWTLAAPGALPVNRPLGTLPEWVRGAAPVSIGGTVSSGNAASLFAVDGDVVSAGSVLTTTNHLPVTAAQFAAIKRVGILLTDAVGGQEVTVELWDYGASQWIGAGTCSLAADTRCTRFVVTNPTRFGRWDAGPGAVEMRARYSSSALLQADFARTTVNG